MNRANETQQHVGKIDLTVEENKIAEQINFSPTGREGYALTDINGDRVCALVKLLNDRGAIPLHRRRYFTDPAFNPGGRGKSNKEIFEAKGCFGEQILRHNHFLKFFRYMIYGANLPQPIIESMQEAVQDCGCVTSSDIQPLVKTARQLARAHLRRPNETSEEFYMLALDLGFDPQTALMFRNSVRAIR